MSNSRVFNRIPILLITPLITVIAVFLAYPILRTVLMSIQYWYLPGKGSETVFVGLENFFKTAPSSIPCGSPAATWWLPSSRGSPWDWERHSC